MTLRRLLFLIALAGPAAIPASVASAQEMPACARSGASNVMIGGRPAFRLSDLAACPPELVEVSPNVTIGGEPVAFLRSGQVGKDACAGAGNPAVTINGKAAQTVGDATCVTAQ